MKNSMEIPQKPSNAIHGYISEKKNDSTNLKRYMYPNVYSSITCNSQDMKATHVSINR